MQVCAAGTVVVVVVVEVVVVVDSGTVVVVLPSGSDVVVVVLVVLVELVVVVVELGVGVLLGAAVVEGLSDQATAGGTVTVTGTSISSHAAPKRAVAASRIALRAVRPLVVGENVMPSI